MPSPLTRGAHAIVLMALLVGCGSPAPSVEPTIPERPAVPDGWREVTSDAGDVRLALPADLDLIFTGSGIMAQREMPDGEGRLEVIAVGPADVLPQPRSGEQVRTWLEQTSWVPVAGEGGITQTADRTEREVLLPAGRALEVAMTAGTGSPDEGRVMVYAIATKGGLAIIRFVGRPATINAQEGELRLIALLAQFGDLDDPS
jgi:hypothetical protein